MIQDKQLALAVQLHDEAIFDNFYGETNITAVNDLKQFIDRELGDVNSFYLFGGKSLGKSHLLNAAAAYANDKGLTSLCLSLSELKSLSTELLEGLEAIDLICLDDLDLVAKDLTWQKAIFDLYNRIVEQGKLIVLSSNDTATNLNLSLPDLESRLSWGLTLQLKALNDEEKMQALKFRAAKRGITFQQESIAFLFNRYSRDMEELIDCLDKLDTLSIQSQRKITIPFIKEALSGLL
jgi:DnaA-homolog protein